MTEEEKLEHHRKLDQLLEDNFQKFKTPMQTTRHAMIHEDDDALIVCAACINSEGKVVPSVRHGDKLLYNVMDEDEVILFRWVQGFVTNRFSFVTRKEAWIIAERQGQIRNQLPCDHSKRLYSENLY